MQQRAVPLVALRVVRLPMVAAPPVHSWFVVGAVLLFWATTAEGLLHLAMGVVRH
jgi:hypothetical protein